MTGSTGGIGLETARLLLAEGAGVVTCGRRDAPGIGEPAHVVVDLAQPGGPERAVTDAARALGGLDVLVNNAGVARQALFEEVPDDEWDAYWQLNVMSYVRAIRAALPHLRERRRRDRQRLLHGREAPVDRDAALLGDEGGRAVALAPRRRPLCE